MKSKMIKLLTLCSILFIFACGKKAEEVKTEATPEDNRVPVTVVNTALGEFKEYGEYYGRVQGINRASIVNYLNGTVDSVSSKEGDNVKEGDSLAKISAEEASLLLKTTKLNEKIALDNYKTQKRFLQNGNTTPLNVDQAELAYLNSKKQRMEAETVYEGAFCIAPISGMVVSRNIDVNDTVAQGQQTFLIEDLSKIEISIGIPEGDMEGIEEGSSAEVTLDLYPERVWKGTLTRLSRRSSDMNLTFTATVVVDNRDGKILSGTTAKVKVLRNEFLGNVIIPSDTVINEDGKNYVMVVNGEKVEKRLVVLGAASIEESVILEGLQAGESIVQEGIHLVSDSQLVTIAQEGV